MYVARFLIKHRSILPTQLGVVPKLYTKFDFDRISSENSVPEVLGQRLGKEIRHERNPIQPHRSNSDPVG